MDENGNVIKGFEYIGKKPVVGAPSSLAQGGVIRELDEEGRIKRVRTSGAPLDTRYVKTPQEAATPERIGDYYYDKMGNLQVVQNSPTDIYNQWRYTEDNSLYSKPKRSDFSSGSEATELANLGGAALGSLAAGTAAKSGLGAALGAAGSLGLTLGPMAALSAVSYAQKVGAEEKAYKEALEEWNKSQEKAVWKIAGDFKVDENGNVKFTPNASKAINMNAEFAGPELRKAFDRETQVYFGDDGRLKINVNPVFAATDEFTEMLDNIKKAYGGLTKDSDGDDETVEEIKGYIDEANNQFKFREESLYSYKRELPNAPDAAIEDAYTNIIGAYISEGDSAKYDVKVYRNGEIVTQTAKEVLDNVYNKDLGKRSDYIIELNNKLEDPTISDEDKVYILSELKLLNAADSNENTYDNGVKDENGDTVKSRNKYYGMLDQESIIPWLANPILFGVSMSTIVGVLDRITPWDMKLNLQEGLQPDPAATSAAKIIGTATSAISTMYAMQGIEHGIMRPLLGKLGSFFGKIVNLEEMAARGGRISNFIGNVQLSAGALANSARETFPAAANLIAGARLSAAPVVKTLGYSMSELLYNATSDLAFDAAKQGVKALAGENPTSEEFLEEFGTDLVMDLIMQYGPAGLASMQTELDNYRLETVYEPFKPKLEKALQILDTAELDFSSAKSALSEMKKGTKKYKVAEADVAEKQKVYENAKKDYTSIKSEADAAIKEAFPTGSEYAGSALAGSLSKLEQNNVIMWLRKKLFDENAALSTVAEQAYAKTGDVYYYAAAVNKFQSIQAGITEVKAKMMADMYVKGTGEAYFKFADAVKTVAPSTKFSKTQIEYLVARAEYESWMRTAEKDAELAEKVEKKYAPYFDRVQGSERTQLDDVLETLKAFLQKVGENYVKSGAATKKQMKDIEDATLGAGYIPLWGKGAKTQTFGIFQTPLTLRVGRDFDAEKGLFDVEGIKNPVESALNYTHNIANNIARNEMAAMLQEIASLDVGGVKLVGSGTPKDAEYQDIIDQAIANVTQKETKLLDFRVDEDKYYTGLKKSLSVKDHNAVSKSIDELIPKQKELQRLIDLNNKEKDPIKKAKRLQRIANLDGKVRESKAQIRESIDNRVRVAGEYFNKTYKDYGFTVDIENTLTSKKYTDMIDGRLRTFSNEDLVALKEDVQSVVNQVAPYIPIKKLNKKAVDSVVSELRTQIDARVKENNPDGSKPDRKKIVNRVIASFRARLSGDYSSYGSLDDVDAQAGYKINFTQNGQDASFYITGRLAQEVATEMNTRNINDRRAIAQFFREAANIKRLLTTGIDPTRVLPNLVRDTVREGVFSGGTDYWFFDNSPFGFQAMFTAQARAAGDTDEQIENALKIMRASQDVASGATYNQAFSGGQSGVRSLVKSSVEHGDSRGTKIVWNLAHNKRGVLEMPMDWAEGLTRNRAASSAFYRAYMRGAGVLDQETRLDNAFQAGVNAGRENTVNFMRRGTAIKRIAAYVPYLSQKFSSIESTKIAFLKDPIGVSTRLMMFGAAYMSELSRVLSNDESRKNYYNLSEYDRENNIVLSLGDNTLVTIPLDDTIASIIYPWRRGLETLQNVDPEDFYMIMVNGFLDLSPFDLSGFTEGDSFNFGRGLEKLGAQTLPTILQAAYTQASGRNMYYGSTVEVTADNLAEYGNYNPTPGDFTTASANSQILRSVADFFGIEQWKLQQVVSDLGGNVGQYVINILDKIGGAPENAQGGKDFMDATFKSFTGMDSNQVYYAFNDGIAKLEQDKQEVVGQLTALNSQISLASGERLAELQSRFTKIKQEFALKVGNFVEKYINGYEIAGGLTKTQANRIWYLLNFSEDDSITMAQSVEADYRNQAKTAANKETSALAAPILDKYYDQTKNVYRDDDGTWRYYAPYGEQAFFNTVSGRGAQYTIGLKNILEGKMSSLYTARSQAKTARSAAANAGNWDEYDRIGLAFDEQVLNAIVPYVVENGIEETIYNNQVLEYLKDWFFVPSSYMKSKYGKNVSLAHNASKQAAFVKPYIKELFGLSTEYQEGNYIERPNRLVRGE